MKNKIVIIGSGWAGAALVKHLNCDNFDVTVISKDLNFIYTPLLTYKSLNNINLSHSIGSINDIKTIKSCIKLEMIDFNNNSIRIDEQKIDYDYLVFANGAEINTFNIEGVEKFCYYINNFNIKEIEEINNIYVIGTGPTGTEMIGHLLDYQKINNLNFKIVAIDGLKGPVSMIRDNKMIIDFWNQNKVSQYYENFVKKITTKNIITTKTSFDITTNDIILWLGGVKITPLSLGVNNLFNNTNRRGIETYDNFLVKNSKNVFAIGDCNGLNYPPTAQVAYQQGKFLANNFNNNTIDNLFKYNNRGSFFYYGLGNSVYYHNKMQFGGKIVGFINNFVHLYNCINLKQSFEIFKEKYLK